MLEQGKEPIRFIEYCLINDTMNHLIKDDVFFTMKDDVFLEAKLEELEDDNDSLNTEFLLNEPPPLLFDNDMDLNFIQPIKDENLFKLFNFLNPIESNNNLTIKPNKIIKKKNIQIKKKLDKKLNKKSSPNKNWIDCQLIEERDDNKTIFQHLTEQSIDWCRYCGTTEGVNWRPGPWGKRTLCNKHGCDYKGYGLASRLPRLDLSLFNNEKLNDRIFPVIQHFCNQCQSPEISKENILIHCHGGCSRAYHKYCYTPNINLDSSMVWYCSSLCKENRKRNKVVVELPRKHLPLIHLLSKSMIKKSSSY